MGINEHFFIRPLGGDDLLARAKIYYFEQVFARTRLADRKKENNKNRKQKNKKLKNDGLETNLQILTGR